MIRVAAALLGCVWSLTAQYAQEIRQWKAPAGEMPVRPRSACSALRGLTGYELSIMTADLHPASGGTPEFCRVMGQVMPEVRFEVALPAQWNKRLLMIGNGGYAGENLEAPGRITTRNEALTAGFVFTQTNTGHDAEQEPLGSFAVNSQKLLDYAFRAVHVTAETAKKIAAAYYGAGPSRSYFQGCSTGGRQALISAQRFPQDFDGIVAGAPVLDFTGTILSFTNWVRNLPATSLPQAKMKLLADRIYAHCDAKDGLQDGLIEDPRECGFRPAEHLLKCAGTEAGDCFTEAQIRSLEAVYNDLQIGGKRVFPGMPVGAEVAGANGRSGWDPWLLREGQPPIGQLFSETFFRYLAFPKKDPSLQLTQVDFERDEPRLGWIRKVLDATDTDLTGFRDRGGKLLMWFGWADPALNPLMGVSYYEGVRQKMGARTGDFFRLYMMPGVFHCAGGVGPDTFPRLAALIDWVEQGRVPETLVAARRAGDKVVRTRPLCPYPQVAKYSGTGSVDDAANFRCAAVQYGNAGAR
jgi:feruloyl esterase